jgi:putative acetyltransferase
MDIVIRAAEVRDAEAITRIYNAPRAQWGTLQLPFVSVEARRKRLAEPRPGFYNLVAEVEGDVIGSIGMDTFGDRPRKAHVASIGMAVRDDWQSKGVGTALMQAVVDLADRWLQIRRMELEVYTDNLPAIALYKKFGFEIEGTLRMYAFRDGQYVDAYAMARLQPGLPGLPGGASYALAPPFITSQSKADTPGSLR